MDLRNIVWISLLYTFFSGNSLTAEKNCNTERKCKITHTYGFKAADCYRMDWKEFPKCLPYNTEVIELSYNRIRKVSKSDIQRYPYVRHLYLTDNLIVNLDEETIRELKYLETLDLSLNAIAKILPAIFQLPSLKTLYLSQNWNINIAESIENSKPISSPLTKLDISYITEEGDTTNFPDFGELPLLAALNITGDQFNYLSTRHFAGLCNLQILANLNVTAEYETGCECWKINQWLKDRKIQFDAFSCPVSEDECLDKEINQEDLDIYRKCRAQFDHIERTALLTKVGLGVGITLLTIVFMALIFVYRRWRKTKQQKKTVKDKKEVLNPSDDGLQLLKNETKI